MSGEIKQASQEKDLTENQSAECKAIAPEQSAAESGEEGSGPSWKDKQKIKTLEEIDAQQKKQMEALTAELKEAETALTNQKTKKFPTQQDNGVSSAENTGSRHLKKGVEKRVERKEGFRKGDVRKVGERRRESA